MLGQLLIRGSLVQAHPEAQKSKSLHSTANQGVRENLTPCCFYIDFKFVANL